MTNIPFGPLGYFTYKRTYARKLPGSEETEEFEQTIDRVINSCNTQLGCSFTPSEQKEYKELLLNLKGSVAGRFLWQLGTDTVNKLGLMSLQNCALTVVDEPIRPFTWTFDALMLGCGVGYNIQKENVYQLPKVKHVKSIERKDTNDADFIVPDSREGWVQLLEKVLESYFITGKSFTYSTVCVRGKGAPIKSFGGTASGPEELCWGMAEIGKVLQAREGKKVRPIDVLDIMNIIGFVVVSGNVRRSAAIAIGDADDVLFLNAKNWSQGNVPNWRAMSNNSVVCNDIKYLPEAFWNGYTGDGEPYGLINLKLSRKEGRLGEERPDKNIVGYNPCAEQGLENKETCCLAELFLPRLKSLKEAQRMAYFLYRTCKHSLALPCHASDTQAIVHKNMRMGIGVTGYLQATEEQRSWLPAVYEYLRKVDKEYSAKQGWPESIKLTTAKPSGTLSLLPGVTPGVHPGFARYYIRRIRVASNSPLAELCRTNGYDVEFQKNFDGSNDNNTVVVSFPCELPEEAIVSKNLSAVQQLEYVNRVQKDWSDNGVSVTVYYKLEELAGIKEWLKKNYNKSLKAVSFLLHSEHGFVQAPYEEIDLDTYIKMNAKIKPIHSVNVNFGDVSDNLECASGACPVR